MGDPKYIEKIFTLYSEKIGNIDEKQQTTILLAVRQSLTKKEYKAFFNYMDLSDDEKMVKLGCNADKLEKLLKNASRKLKTSPLQNTITDINKINKIDSEV